MIEDAIILKIKKLLALSKSSNIHEAQNAAAIANKYILKYRLAEADFEEKKSSRISQVIQSIYDDPEPAYESARVREWKLDILNLLAHHYGCALWNDIQYKSSPKGTNISRFRLVGRVNDIQFTKSMFNYIITEIQNHANIECKGLGHVAFGSYCKGAVKGIETLLFEARNNLIELANQKGNTSLVKVNNREEEAKKYLHKKYHLVQPAEKRPRFDPAAFERGYDVGNAIGGRVGQSSET